MCLVQENSSIIHYILPVYLIKEFDICCDQYHKLKFASLQGGILNLNVFLSTSSYSVVALVRQELVELVPEQLALICGDD